MKPYTIHHYESSIQPKPRRRGKVIVSRVIFCVVVVIIVVFGVLAGVLK